MPGIDPVLVPPPPITNPSPAQPAAIWAQLSPQRRRQLQRLLADLLTRPILTEAATSRESHHDSPA